MGLAPNLSGQGPGAAYDPGGFCGAGALWAGAGALSTLAGRFLAQKTLKSKAPRMSSAATITAPTGKRACRPALHRAFELKSEVVVQSGRPVLLDHELPGMRPFLAALCGLWVTAKLRLALYLVRESHPSAAIRR